MMFRYFWRPALWISLAIMMPGCAVWPRTLTAVPPRLTLPGHADRPCRLTTLKSVVAGSGRTEPSTSDLATAYVLRGEDILACDLARQAAIQTLKEERHLQDRWRATAAAEP